MQHSSPTGFSLLHRVQRPLSANHLNVTGSIKCSNRASSSLSSRLPSGSLSARYGVADNPIMNTDFATEDIAWSTTRYCLPAARWHSSTIIRTLQPRYRSAIVARREYAVWTEAMTQGLLDVSGMPALQYPTLALPLGSLGSSGIYVSNAASKADPICSISSLR